MSVIKTIKFDLPIDGVNVKTLEELREHFTVEILTLYNNGILLKWLRSRKNLEEASRLEAIPVALLSRVSLLKTLCEIFKVDTDDMILSAALGMPPEKIEKNFPEIKAQYRAIASVEVKTKARAEIEALEAKLRAEVQAKVRTEVETIEAKLRAEFASRVNPPKILGKYKIYNNGIVTNTETGLMWKQPIEGEYKWNDAIRKFGKNFSFSGYNDWWIPTQKELETLLNHDSHLNNNDDIFWSISSVTGSDHLAWGINFNYRYSDWYSKDNVCKVRLVRNEK